MKFIKLDLLTLLISLFALSSCESTSTIGLEVDPSAAVQGKLFDKTTIVSRTVAEDQTSTYGLTRHPLGYLIDPVFGTTEASLAMSVNLPSDAYDFGTAPILDSAVLVLNYNGEFYGDSTSNYSVDVHQLTNNLSKESSFLSNKTYLRESALLGNKTGKIYPKTKFKITDRVAGKADTLLTVTPQMRIKLNNQFISDNIVNSAIVTRKYNSYFNAEFRGLHVEINKTNTASPGGLMFFDFASTNSYLALYYRKQNSTTATVIDTVPEVKFPITTTSNPIAATVVHNYTGTDVATQLANPTTQYPVTYIQPLAGVRNKISFPDLSNLRTTEGKVAINKAELVIDLANGTDVSPFAAAPRLTLYRYDIAQQRKNVPDNDVSTQLTQGDARALTAAVFGGYFNSITKQYVFVITSYVQDLLDGKTEDYGTFLAAVPLTDAVSLLPSYSTGGRAVIGSYKSAPAASDKVIKLNIYYTKIN